MSDIVTHDDELRQIQAICERLFREADAKLLILSDTNGQLIYSIGEADGAESNGMPSVPTELQEDEFSLVLPDDDARPNVYGKLISGRLILVVLFALASRAESVRTATIKAAELIDFVMRTVKWAPGRG